MLKIRVIPVLLLKNNGLVKTVKFKSPKYIGDPINAVKIFNDKEVDELIFLDISATPNKLGPNFNLIKNIASEAFMPFGYGGGISTIDEIEKLFHLGVEKVILNTSAYNNPQLITKAAKVYGNQSIVVSIDVKTNFFKKKHIFVNCGKHKINQNPVEYAQIIEELGAGEIFINSIDRDGTMTGYDLELVKSISDAVNIPVVACGGAGNLQDFRKAVLKANASAVAAGSMFVFNGIHKAVLISYPSYNELERLFNKE